MQAAIVSALLIGREEVKQDRVGLDDAALAKVCAQLEGVLPPKFQFGTIGLSTLLVYLRAVAELAVADSYKAPPPA